MLPSQIIPSFLARLQSEFQHISVKNRSTYLLQGRCDVLELFCKEYLTVNFENIIQF